VNIALDRVTFGFAGRPLFAGLDLSVRAGESVGIVGPNGSGKSTLLRLMAGLLEPSAGAVSVDGRPASGIGRTEFARLVALVLQETHFAFDYTVLDVVLMGRHAYLPAFARPGRADRELAMRAMERLDIAGLAHQGINRISSGERQRALLARALVQEPRGFLLDEATSHLDLRHQAAVMAALHELVGAGRTVVICSHDINLAALHCGRIVLVEEGRVRADGTAEEVVTQETLRSVYGLSVVVVPHPENGRPQVLLPRA
jgi:iron complex transport system ATP-binding protein